MQASFIIPTHNRARTLRQTLCSVHTIAKEQDVEVLVIDNASTDDTPQVCRKESGKWRNGQFHYFFEPIPGLLSGRHRGAQESGGEFLVYLDDDVVLQSNWFRGFLDVFSDPEVAVAGGPSFPIYETPPPDWLEGLWEDLDGGRHCGHLSLINQGSVKKVCDPANIWGLNFAIRREALYSCGGFHPDCVPAKLQRFQGDGETGLSVKIHQKGWFAVYHPDLKVSHLIPKDRLEVSAFERRAFYQGVCDSYTQIRKFGSVETPVNPNFIKKAYESFRRSAQKERILRKTTSDGMKLLMRSAHGCGYEFHQSEVRKDPALLDWVLKPDYFDYRLPEGWKKYLQ